MKTEEQRIAERYKKFGVTERQIKQLVQSGIDRGISYQAALIGVRMCLGKEFKQREYFTAQDVAEVTGETVEEVNRCIEKNKAELMKDGGLIEVTPAPYLPGLNQYFS